MLVFNIAGIAVSAFFIAFILSKKNKKRADFWLILINLLMIGFLTVVILAQEHFTVTRFFLQTQLPFYLFPVLLLFAMDTLQKAKPLWFLLFLPAFMTTVSIGTDLYLIHDYNNPELLQEVYNNPPFFYHIFYKGNQIFFIAVLGWLIKGLHAYKKEIKDNFSFTDPIELSWLSNVCWIFLILTCTSLAIFLLSNFKVFPIDAEASFSIISACMAILIFYLSFQGVRQYSIADYYDRPLTDQVNVAGLSTTGEGIDAKEKYRASSLTQADQESIYGMVSKLFENDAIYQESRLQLQDVSDILKVPASNLSQTINTVTGKPFYDFVNGYRVKYLQKLLADPDQKRFTILALGLESGFNSKASLNRVFKEHTGLSPSAYQRRHLLK